MHRPLPLEAAAARDRPSRSSISCREPGAGIPPAGWPVCGRAPEVRLHSGKMIFVQTDVPHPAVAEALDMPCQCAACVRPMLEGTVRWFGGLPRLPAGASTRWTHSDATAGCICFRLMLEPSTGLPPNRGWVADRRLTIDRT